MTSDLREILRPPVRLDANPQFYDYIRSVSLREDGSVEMIAGAGQALRRRIVGKHRVTYSTSEEAEIHFFDLLDTDPYERRPETAKVDDMKLGVVLEVGPFALQCEVVWNVTEDKRPWLLVQRRLRFSDDPLAAGQPELPKELLEHPETKALFEGEAQRREARRRYYRTSDGVELSQQEILGMGLPDTALTFL